MDNSLNRKLLLKQEEDVWLQHSFTRTKIQALLDYRQTLLTDAMKQSAETEVGRQVALRLLIEARTVTQVVKQLDPNYNE